jgi:hypothetical protein
MPSNHMHKLFGHTTSCLNSKIKFTVKAFLDCPNKALRYERLESSLSLSLSPFQFWSLTQSNKLSSHFKICNHPSPGKPREPREVRYLLTFHPLSTNLSSPLGTPTRRPLAIELWIKVVRPIYYMWEGKLFVCFVIARSH